MPSTAPSLGRLLAVVRRNPQYRRLFFANAISQIGDSLDTVALFSLLLELTGRGESVAVVLVARLLPMFIAGPLAGVVADRLPRRAILVSCDLLRAGLVACLLLVHRPEQVPIAYAVIALHAFVSAFFEPAQLAVFPNLVAPEDLVVASAIDNTLWSTTLAVGSALGGLVMAAWGRDATFLCDSASFLLSALLLRHLPDGAPRAVRSGEEPSTWSRALGLTDFLEGARYVAGHAQVRSLIVMKGGFGLTLGGVLVLLAYFGEKVFSSHSGRGIAALWMARGVGSFAGPLLAWRLGGDAEPALRRGITFAFATVCASYLAFSQAGALGAAALALAIANAGGSILWTYGSALQQAIVPDAMRGRVFAADMGFMTLTMTASTLAVGTALDGGAGPRLLMASCGLVALVPIAFWLAAQRYFRESATGGSAS